jgi:hypothetical protein
MSSQVCCSQELADRILALLEGEVVSSLPAVFVVVECSERGGEQLS